MKTSARRASVIRLRERVTLEEAVYLVIERTDGIYNDALNLLLEAVMNGGLPSILLPHSGSWPDGSHRVLPEEVDPSKSTARPVDVEAWLNILIPPAKPAASTDEAVAPSSELATTEQTANPPPKLEWIDAARRLASDVGVEQWGAGIRQISARGVSEKVAERLAKNRSYWGERGPRDAATIRKQALRGWEFVPPVAGDSGDSGASPGEDSPH